MHKESLKIRLGLNFATVFVTFCCCCFELLVVCFTLFTSIYFGRWDQWHYCLYVLYALMAIWMICFVVALIVCRKRLVIEGRILRVEKGGKTLYECEVSEITSIQRKRFSPILDSEPGSIIIENPKNPIPNGIDLFMDWVSYKRVVKLIKKKQSL